MDSSFTNPRKSYDIPTPETGLAEWTSKIKALQREVDADEEAEQRRLEEEISAARQARLRRSRGPGASRIEGLDSGADNQSDAPRSVAERAIEQETALRKLMGRNEVYNPDKIALSPSVDKSNPTSLASFIGGRATGPRLNKHAAQVDAHDPSQFIQPDLSAPHPVFGKGGVAMPGMVAKKEPSKLASTDTDERYRPSPSPTPAFKSTPSPMVTQVNQVQEKPAPQIKEKVAPEPQQDAYRRRSFTTPRELSNTPTSPIKPADKVDRSAYASDELLQRNRTSSTYGTRPTSYTPTPKQEEPPAPRTFNTTVTTSKAPTTPASNPTPSSTPSSKVLPTYGGVSLRPTGNLNSPLSKKPVEPNTNLRRIMQNNQVYNPDESDDHFKKTVAERAQGVSLAGFIGGSGTGPRLNRHAPQVDAHDPTQYVQPDTSAPHPIFGKGGVAMPGMVTRKTDPGAGSEPSERYRPVSASKPIWPPVATNYNKPQDRPVSPQKTGNRERTISAPNKPNFGSTAAQSSGWTPPSGTFGTSRTASPTKELRPNTPGRERTISGPSPSMSSSNITTPSLARPIQPTPKFPSQTPQIIPAGVAASPAFQRSTPTKDLTPSISRLQGRGFVQNMVKVSSQYEAPTSPTPVVSRPASATGKKGSVLDRWQPNTQSSSPTKSSFTPDPVRRSTTHESNTTHSYTPRTPTPGNANNNSKSHSLKSVASLPSMAKSSSTPVAEPSIPDTSTPDPYPRSRTPGLGSATTMVLIKPKKSITDLTQIPVVDELGVKHNSSSSSSSSQVERAPYRAPADSSKKPLIHPTRERAKKPKKTDTRRDNMGDVKPDTTTTTSTAPDLQDKVSSPAPAATPIVTEVAKPKDKVKPEPLKVAPFSSISGTPVASPTPTPRESTGRASPRISSPGLPLPSPIKQHSRTPSTGSRPTVMQVAQLFGEAFDAEAPESPSHDNKDTLSPLEPATPRSRANFAQMQAEKRKSSYEKYSAIILPPLKEEATPTPTPEGTLKNVVPTPADPAPIPTKSQISVHAPIQDAAIAHEPNASSASRNTGKSSTTPPALNIKKLLDSQSRHRETSHDNQTISVEVFAIIGTTASPITGAPDVFYDTEILAVIHRVKSKSSGLASTSVWCWLGARSTLGDREGRKLEELAKRYGTTAKMVYQRAETPEFIQVIGGSLAIRQGSRAHWSAENTTMHLVRSVKGGIFIDEHDLNIKNLCSAFSYCFTILGSIYVWHGRGSTVAERKAAMEYSGKLTSDSAPATELVEGETDDDEMFWLILGDDDYAKADYWKWRASSSQTDPYVLKVDARNPDAPVTLVESLSMRQDISASVFIIDGIWELFVLVGKDARHEVATTRLALEAAQGISKEVSASRPYPPTIHVMVLPSQVPIDLRLSVRDLDEAWLNEGEIPDHMNLLPCSEVLAQLDTGAWKNIDHNLEQRRSKLD